MRLTFIRFFAAVGIFSLALAGCNLPGAGASDSAVQATLAALGATQTALAAPAAENPSATEPPAAEIPTATLEPATEEPTATLTPVVHAITPGEPAGASSLSFMTDFNNWGSGEYPVKAGGGDNFDGNNMERPFTQEMKYRPDLDILRADLYADANFFYVVIKLRDVSAENKQLNGTYGVEFDLDKDGRGDFLLLGMPIAGDPSGLPHANAWTIEGVRVYTDANNDVGKATPMRANPPSTPGDGYETLIMDGSARVGDLDGAWQRTASDGVKIELAIKRALLGSPVELMWGALADDGLKAPEKLDYNDAFTLGEAGSSMSGPNFPLKALYAYDNTCRSKWGFVPTGKEPGICEGAVPQPTPTKVCSVSITVRFTDNNSRWVSSWAPYVTACVADTGGGGDCKNPNADGTYTWTGLPAGGYTVTASSTAYSVTPPSYSFKLDCERMKSGVADFVLYIP